VADTAAAKGGGIKVRRVNPSTARRARAAAFHPFQELATLAQRLARPLSLGQGLSGVESMFPGESPRSSVPTTNAEQQPEPGIGLCE
jgi:hypothetical protein